MDGSTETEIATIALGEAALRLHPADDVAVAKAPLFAGQTLVEGDLRITVCQPQMTLGGRPIPTGHKVALREIAAGAPVHRYGQVIGFATRTIAPGEHVHVHNVGILGPEEEGLERETVFGVDVRPAVPAPADEQRTFMGYRRADGRVGTRNTIAVISTVNCSAHAAREIARHFTPERLAAFPCVDGVVALTHTLGCPMRYTLLRRTLAGMARHPNVGGFVLVGLGCETNQAADLMTEYGLSGPALVIQELGGLRRTVQAGIEAVEALLPQVNEVARTPQPASALTVALQCGGSDSWSGVTANPVVGLVSDEIVRQGGAVVLTETPEIYGAEHLLTRRAVSREIGAELLAQVRWWEAYARRMGFDLDQNRSVGNQAGGLTTIYEKSLGAVIKAGSTPLTGVYEYAAPVTTRGLAFMNSPGYDPVAVTGQVAGGCTLVLFTTGRGSVLGFELAPTIKIATTTALYARMADDMDLDAGRVLAGEPPAAVADELFELLLAVASGQPSKSEAQGVGEAEFVPWDVEGTL
ncbi:MAG TPA: altronate dehydratase [Chloroflexi bacterium]|nr:altronate dehydratase [Chloroflexota bacterium]